MSEPCWPPLLSLELQGVTQGVPKGGPVSSPPAALSLAVSLPRAVSPQEQCQGQEEQRQRDRELGSAAAVLGVFLGDREDEVSACLLPWWHGGSAPLAFGRESRGCRSYVAQPEGRRAEGWFEDTQKPTTTGAQALPRCH